jgi:hypothetical protein
MSIGNGNGLYLVGGLGALSAVCFGVGVILETHAKLLNKTSSMKKIEEVTSKVFQILPTFAVLTIAGSLLAGPIGLGIGAAIGAAMILTPIVNSYFNTAATQKADQIVSLASKVVGTAAVVLLTGYFSGLPAAIGALVIAGALDLINLDVLQLRTVHS